jgi:hypothetical protein
MHVAIFRYNHRELKKVGVTISEKIFIQRLNFYFNNFFDHAKTQCLAKKNKNNKNHELASQSGIDVLNFVTAKNANI